VSYEGIRIGGSFTDAMEAYVARRCGRVVNVWWASQRKKGCCRWLLPVACVGLRHSNGTDPWYALRLLRDQRVSVETVDRLVVIALTASMM
jgi:hypothetical protein